MKPIRQDIQTKSTLTLSHANVDETETYFLTIESADNKCTRNVGINLFPALKSFYDYVAK